MRRLLRRDDRLCGVHLGGCGKEIKQGRSHNRDHIIPRSLFSKVARGRENEFEQDWNCQPMHEACNTSKSFQMDSWPRFDCRCHFLQVADGDLYVCTVGKVGRGSHKLLSNVVSDFPESPERGRCPRRSGSSQRYPGATLRGVLEGPVWVHAPWHSCPCS